MSASSLPHRWSTDQLIAGIEAGPWLRILRDNGFRVDPAYLHRVAWVGGLSVLASLLGAIESVTVGGRVAATPIDPAPIFVLGHWRSGTTHLHNLLGRAPGHTYPTVFQCIFPGCFLTAGRIIPPLTAPLLTATRSYDNVAHGWSAAAEDEIALAKLTGLSPYLAFMFPDRAEAYERYVDFDAATPEEVGIFGDALEHFVRKIMYQTGSRVVVKSCGHSARIPMLLERFPDARFVHIHRDPYTVFASTLHMRSHTDWENFFHLPEADVDQLRRDQTLRLGRRVFEGIIDQRDQIPAGRLVELAYEDLCGDEVATLAGIYEALDLPEWDAAEPVISAYVDGLAGYRRNTLALSPEDRAEVYAHWGCAFDAFGYLR